MPDVDLAIFDLSGATVQADADPRLASLRDALAAEGVAADDAALLGLRTLPRLHALRVLVAASPRAEALRQRVGAIHLDAAARLVGFYRSDPSLREAPGAGDLFRALRRAGVRVGIASDLPRDLTDLVLARLRWQEDGLLSATIAEGEAPRAAPHPDAVQALMRHFGVTHGRRVARIGESPLALAQGAAAGCGRVIALAADGANADDRTRAHYTDRVATLRDVATALGIPD